VPPGDNTVVTVTLYAKSAFKLLPNKHLLNIGVRGGPQLKLGIKADLELPDIDVLTDEIDFGEVHVGSLERVPLKIRNNRSRFDSPQASLPAPILQIRIPKPRTPNPGP
jgi:hypothetical protein